MKRPPKTLARELDALDKEVVRRRQLLAGYYALSVPADARYSVFKEAMADRSEGDLTTAGLVSLGKWALDFCERAAKAADRAGIPSGGEWRKRATEIVGILIDLE